MTRPLRLQICMEMGIVPLLDAADVRKDVGRALANLPPEESRTIRRKFRKQWRSEARRAARQLGMRKRDPAGPAELGTPAPSRKAKLERKWMVLMAIMEEERRLRGNFDEPQGGVEITPF